VVKKLNSQIFLLYLRCMWELVENVIWEGWQKRSEYRYMGDGS